MRRIATIGFCLLFAAGTYLAGPRLLRVVESTRFVNYVDWEVDSPQEAGIDPQRLDQTLSELLSRNTKALVIVKDDKLIYEWYREGRNRNTRFTFASAAKPLFGAIVLALSIQEGVVRLDQPVSDYLPQWQSHPQKRRITFRQLASHTSGMEDVPFYRYAGRKHQEEWQDEYEADPESRFGYALDTAELKQEPGTGYIYSGVGYYILSYAITRAWQQRLKQPDLLDLYTHRMIEPLGMHQRAWQMSYGLSHRIAGMTLYSIGSGATLTGRAAARVAQVIKNKGSYQGRQLIEKGVVEDLLRPAEVEETQARSAGTSPITGAGWYLNTNGYFRGVPRDALIAFGAGPQVVIVSSALELIIVRIGDSLNGSDRGDEDASSVYFRELFDFLSGRTNLVTSKSTE